MPSADTNEPRFAGTVGRLTSVNVVVAGLGVVTGVLQARGLGPEGRGDLAAIVVPLAVLALIGDLGFGMYVRREAARGVLLGPVLGTIGGITLAIGAALAVLLSPLREIVADQRDVVTLWLGIGLVLLPVNLLGGILRNAGTGLGRWDLWGRSRLVLSAGWLVALVVLYGTGRLTVGWAAGCIAALTVASSYPFLGVLARARPIGFDRRILVHAVPFSARAWFADVSNLVNLRVDQLLMAAMVDSRQLGLYAVAVTLAGLTGTFSTAVGLALLPRVAREGPEVVPRAVRTSLAIVVLAGGTVALLASPLVHLGAGSAFGPAVQLVWVLLVAEVPLAGTIILGQALIGSGRPGGAAAGQGLGMALSLGGLLVALPRWGAMGAAIVSLVAYSSSFAWMLGYSGRAYGRPIREFLVPDRRDVTWMVVAANRITTSRLAWLFEKLPGRSGRRPGSRPRPDRP